jgi:hypothetical protein
MAQQSDDAILAEMLQLSDQLCRTTDVLLIGQYRHLQDRIRALIELRECARVVKAE